MIATNVASAHDGESVHDTVDVFAPQRIVPLKTRHTNANTMQPILRGVVHSSPKEVTSAPL